MLLKIEEKRDGIVPIDNILSVNYNLAQFGCMLGTCCYVTRKAVSVIFRSPSHQQQLNFLLYERLIIHRCATFPPDHHIPWKFEGLDVIPKSDDLHNICLRPSSRTLSISFSLLSISFHEKNISNSASRLVHRLISTF